MNTIQKLPVISSAEELIALVEDIGFIPFFDCGIEGFSVEAVTAPGRWFVDGVDGPWEWKSSFVQSGMAYGKLFRKKTVFMNRKWYGILSCYRRDGYDLEGMYEDGLINHSALAIAEALEIGSLVSAELRRVTGYSSTRKNDQPAGKSFDQLITDLQMLSFVTVSAFEQAIDRKGRPFGWGLARYILSDQRFSEEIEAAEARYTSEQAKKLLGERVSELFPNEPFKNIERFIK